MLYAWWDLKETIHFKLPSKNVKTNVLLYFEQLSPLQVAIVKKGPARHHPMILQMNDATITETIIQKLRVEVSHPAYLAGLASSDYRVSHALSNTFHGRSFSNDTVLNSWVENSFALKPVDI